MGKSLAAVFVLAFLIFPLSAAAVNECVARYRSCQAAGESGCQKAYEDCYNGVGNVNTTSPQAAKTERCPWGEAENGGYGEAPCLPAPNTNKSAVSAAAAASNTLSSSSDELRPCNEALKEANVECNQMSDAATVAIISQLTSAAGRAAGGTNARAGCAGSAIGGGTAMSSTLYVAKSCYDAASACISSCEVPGPLNIQDPEELKKVLAAFGNNQKKCTSLKKRVMLAGAVSGSQLLGLIGQATACEKGLANNTTYPGYTPPPLPDGTIPNINSPSTGNNSYSGDWNPDDPNGPGFDGYKSDKSASTGQASGEAGGGGMGGANAYPGGAANNANNAGGGGNPYKDPDRGFMGGGGGYSVSGVPLSGGGGGGFNNGRREKDGFDLSKFLPGGALDPSKRGPASVQGQLARQGITGANELSNFEKVTRMMNKKRAFLKQ